MIVIRHKVVVQILFFWILCHCHASGALASTTVEQALTIKAYELLHNASKQNLQDHSLALKTAREALAIFQEIKSKPGIARALGDMAQYYFAQSDLLEAETHYQQALQLWREEKNLGREIETINMLGFVESEKGNWDRAISYYMQAQSLINDDSDAVLKSQTAAGLGDLFNENGLPEQALIHYQRALEFARQTEGQLDDDRMTMFIGYSHLLTGNFGAAETYLLQALENQKTAHPAYRANCQEYLAQLEILRENYPAALQYLLPVLDLYIKEKYSKQTARVQGLIGQVYERQGDYNRARTYYLEASDGFRNISDRVGDAAVSFVLGRMELKGGNYDAAEQFLKYSLEDTERIRSTTTGRELTEAFSASVHARYAAYIECLMRKHKRDPAKGLDVVAFQASELARARSLAELLHDTQTNLLTGVDVQLVEREKNLRQLLRAREDYRLDLLSTNYNKSTLDELENPLTRLREDYKQVLEQIRLQNPSFDQISKPATYRLEQIQRDVIEDDRTVLLEYFLGAEASYLWLVTKNSFSAHEIPKDAIVSDAVTKLYELLSQKPNADNDAKVRLAAHELGQMVLTPLIDLLPGRRVIVVADGALNYVPFQVLSAGDKLLIEDAEVVNAPSASILAELRKELAKRKPAANTLAAFGDAAFASNYAQLRDSQSAQPNVSMLARAVSRDVIIGGDLLKPEEIQPLFYVPAELKNIRELAGPTALVATGFDATRQRLQETDLSKYSILHLATHGVLDPKRPEKSGFLLSLVDRDRKEQDGFITMKDVYRLHAPVDLVVLSACRTGLGKEVKGEGLIGLTRGFMHAGASSVASTLWRVDDQATAELMKYFYQNMLQKQMTPAAALREAQNTIRKDPRWSSPHYWAAFTLQGEYKQKIGSPQTSTLPLVVIVIAGVLVLGGIVLKRRFTRR